MAPGQARLLDLAPEASTIVAVERALIGGALLEPFATLPPLLPAEFYLEGHRVIWEALLDLSASLEAPDAAVLAHELDRRGRLEEVGGPSALALLLADGGLSLSMGDYARQIRQAARARELQRLGVELTGRGLTEDEVQTALADLPGPLGSALFDPAENWRRIVDGWQRASKILTGLERLDAMTGGVALGDLMVVAGRTSHGKALALDTPLPTPTGWTTMGAVGAGDQLLSADGRPVTVLRTSDVLSQRPCHRIEFSDGSSIIADADHLWATQTRLERRRGAAAQVRTTQQIAATLLHRNYRNHSIGTCAAFALPTANLLIPPYVLGAWLGDGKTSDGVIFSNDPEVILAIEAAGQPARRRPAPFTYGLPGLKVRLRTVGVLGNKHIPIGYLRGSEAQRRALLAGLLDTDGTVNVDGSVGLDLTRYRLAMAAFELICSFGYRPTMSQRSVKGKGPDTSVCFRLRFVTEDKVFSLQRKAQRHHLLAHRRIKHRNDRRTILSVTPVESVPVKCLEVDARDGLYLAGRSCIPTHNTAFISHLALELARQGVEVELFTLEETPDAMVRRLAANLSGVSARKLREGNLSAEDFEAAERAIRDIQALPLTLTGLDSLRSLGEETVLGAAAHSTARVVMLDHLQKIHTRGESRVYGLEGVMNRLHAQAIRDNRAVIVAVQIGRDMESERRPPRLSDIRDCGAVEILARSAWLLYWPWKHKPERDWNEYELYVAKQTDGGTGLVTLKFEAPTGRFS